MNEHHTNHQFVYFRCAFSFLALSHLFRYACLDKNCFTQAKCTKTVSETNADTRRIKPSDIRDRQMLVSDSRVYSVPRQHVESEVCA